MTARLRKLLAAIGESFWLVPAAMVAAGVLAALGMLRLDHGDLVPEALLRSAWLYDGGATGARTLLGAVASSTIAVAGTVFSITIAALSLAAGQMGPRLLRNFTRDRPNQVALGIFLGTFSYALMVLRSVRTQDEGAFVPHLSLSVAIFMAFVCVVTLVLFVSHMAGRINVDTVIDLVSGDVASAIRRLTTDADQPAPPPPAFWRGARPVAERRRGYLQELDAEGLADWAAANGTAIRLLVRPGGYVFPGAAIAVAKPCVEGCGEAIVAATALGSQRVSSADLELAVRHLVEVAVRALSPGINDPHTAIGVLDQLGAALCELVPLRIPSGVHLRDGRPVLVVPGFDYDGLLDSMFHLIRQNGARSPAVLIRMLEVLTVVAGAERDPARQAALARHADLVLADAERAEGNPADLADVRRRHAGFALVREHGPIGHLGAAAT